MSESRRIVSRPAAGLLAATCLVVLAPPAAGAQMVPAGPAQLLVDAVQGRAVTLRWDPPAGAPPDGYLLEGGFAPDEVAGSLALGSDTATAQVTLPPGLYFIRAYAVAGGVRSAPSNEVRVGVGLLAPPAAPEALTGVTVGHGLVLGWRQSFEGGVPDSVLLQVTGPVSGTFPIAASGSFRVERVPEGVYTVSLRASNAAGTSPATPPLTLALPGLVTTVEEGPSLPPGEVGLPVRYERFDAPRIEQLLAREGLAQVVAGAATEFEAVLALKEWVAAQFPHSDPNPYPPWDALIILDAIRAGLTGGFCAQYSQVMLQSLAALGFPARYVEVGSIANPYAHYPLEYWSNQFNKWILLDVDYNLHFESDGVPLSALEVHDAFVSGAQASVAVVEGAYRLGHPAPAEWPHGTTELYYYVRFHLKADHVFAPNEDPFERWNDMVEWTDERTTPWESSSVDSEFPKVRITAVSTGDRAIAQAPLNRVWVTPRVTSGTEVWLDLAHDMPQIARAEYRVIDLTGTPGPWLTHGSPTLAWHVGVDERAIEVRGVNIKGVAGPATRVTLVAP